MSRFQAKTNEILDTELDDLRRRLGLRANQKAELLRELTAFAAWVVRQADEGRQVLARGPRDERELQHPVLERLRQRGAPPSRASDRLELDDEEVERLAAILDRQAEPSGALASCLQRLAAGSRESPKLSWPAAASSEDEDFD
jgi:hypothetical protein